MHPRDPDSVPSSSSAAFASVVDLDLWTAVAAAGSGFVTVVEASISVVESRRRPGRTPDRVFGSGMCSSGSSSRYMGLVVDHDRGSRRRDHDFVLGSGDCAVGGR
jgi:hypothetical protein